VHAVADEMLTRGWVILRQPTTPPSLHLLITPRHEAVCDAFGADLAAAVAAVRTSGARSAVRSTYAVEK
jgi:hypothetical protein